MRWLFTAENVTSSQPNVTSLVETAVTLHCPLAAAAATTSRITWQKRDNDRSWRAMMVSGDSGGRITIRQSAAASGAGGGDLEFHRLLASDAGFYRCAKKSSRGVDNYSPPVVLVVHGMVTLTCNLTDSCYNVTSTVKVKVKVK